MGRNFKQGLDYFSCDVTFNSEVEQTIAVFGDSTMNVIIRIWQLAYEDKGYYMKVSEDTLFLLERRLIKVQKEEIVNIIEFMLTKNIFDKHLYEQYGILTSKRMQDNFYEAIKRRKNVNINPDYVLINELIDYINRENADKNQQRKEKERKEKKISTTIDTNSVMQSAVDFIQEEWKRLLTGAEIVDIKNMFEELDPPPIMKEIEDAVLITIQRRVHNIKYLQGILEKERATGGFKNVTASFEEVFGKPGGSHGTD